MPLFQSLPEPAIIVPMAAVAADISVKGQATQIFGSENERECKRGVPNLVKTGSMSRGVESGVICWDDNFVGWLKIELMMGERPESGYGTRAVYLVVWAMSADDTVALHIINCADNQLCNGGELIRVCVCVCVCMYVCVCELNCGRVCVCVCVCVCV